MTMSPHRDRRCPSQFLWVRGTTRVAQGRALIALMVLSAMMAGCGQQSADGQGGTPPHASSDGSGSTNVTLAKKPGKQAGGQGNASAGATKQGASIPLAARLAKIIYASSVYALPVPLQDKLKSTHLSAADVPGGIIWVTPAGFPDHKDQPLAAGDVWFTPVTASRGSLWTGARLLTQVAHGSVRLIDVTDGRAIIGQQDSSGHVNILSVDIKTGHTVIIGRHNSGDRTAFGYGAYAWVDGGNGVHVANVRTGRVATLPQSGPVSSLTLAPGGVRVSGTYTKLAVVNHPTYPPVPSDYHWISMDHVKHPVIAVPSTWTQVTQLPGGSSLGVQVTNPNNKQEKVDLWFNGCAGCYEPDVISPQLVNTLTSPLMGKVKGERYTWLDDHTVAYTVPPTKNEKYSTYGLTIGFVTRGGDEEVRVHVPADERSVATAILNSVLSLR